MPITQNFIPGEVSGAPSVVFLTDNSTGSDTLIKSRVVYLQKYDGTYLTLSGEPENAVVRTAVNATCFVGLAGLRTTGDAIVTYVTDPVLGVINLSTYIQQVTDTTPAILNTNIRASINNNTPSNGYSAIPNGSNTYTIVAKPGLGDTINGLEGGASYPGGSVSGNFTGGVTGITLPLAGENYIYWPYADTTISIPILDKSYGLSITVNWLGATNNVLYTKTIQAPYVMYLQQYDDFLISGQQARPNIINDTNYYLNRWKLRVAINDAINSILNMSDITNSQQACDRGTYLIDNANLFF